MKKSSLTWRLADKDSVKMTLTEPLEVGDSIEIEILGGGRRARQIRFAMPQTVDFEVEKAEED